MKIKKKQKKKYVYLHLGKEFVKKYERGDTIYINLDYRKGTTKQ